MDQELNKTLQKLFAGKATQEEIDQINDWYHRDDDHFDLEIEDHFGRSRSQVKQSLFHQIKVEILPTSTLSKFIRIGLPSLAAMVVIGLLVLMVNITGVEKDSSEVIPFELGASFSNDQGMIKSILLPDGSKVYLHHYTTLEVSKNFTHNRKVKLSGKAYFDVASDPNHPFVITTASMNTIVMGTSFSISAYLDSIESVRVKSGLVEVITTNKEVHRLRVNEGLNYQLGTADLMSGFNSEFEFAWIDQTLVFDQSPLPELIKALENWYGVSIECNHFPKRKLSGTFKELSLEELLTAIQYTIPLKFEIYDQKVKIQFIN
ncbi:FecR family protein [Belliella pelovolcani]|uniref:FecR family protein n=1 Tax=Belliella pelovolcani TaxID=529505 RepID=UPI00391AD8DF